MTNTTVKLLLEEYWDKKIPIDPKFYAEKLKLKVLYEDLGSKSGYLDAEKMEIHVNWTEDPRRQRFTIAHELGHFCLGHGSSYRDTSDPNWFRNDPKYALKEAAANQFAAELLMPAVVMNALINVMKIHDAKKLREMLGVSAHALRLRLIALGYINAAY